MFWGSLGAVIFMVNGWGSVSCSSIPVALGTVLGNEAVIRQLDAN
jgi:hypothetical protein